MQPNTRFIFPHPTGPSCRLYDSMSRSSGTRTWEQVRTRGGVVLLDGSKEGSGFYRYAKGVSLAWGSGLLRVNRLH
ncbi:hypothetical protein RSAG8_05648, partial [Rhizoctonia solani AG-8 WAC10335]